MQALDYQLAEIAEGKRLQKKPSEYFASNFHACFWFEKGSTWPTCAARSGSTTACSRRYPHPTGLYPIEEGWRTVGRLTYEERAKVLSLNAAKLYNIAV
jgi:hypothetical protein